MKHFSRPLIPLNLKLPKRFPYCYYQYYIDLGRASRAIKISFFKAVFYWPHAAAHFLVPHWPHIPAHFSASFSLATAL